MAYQIISFLLDVAAGLLGGACLLRLYMQYQRVPFGNPVGRFVFALTDWKIPKDAELGVIRTVGGTYNGYGQRMEIERILEPDSDLQSESPSCELDGEPRDAAQARIKTRRLPTKEGALHAIECI